jgi:hypothetical protein
MEQTVNARPNQVHEFLRDTLNFRYIECVYCKTRSQFTCSKCGSCYSCHRKNDSPLSIPKYFILGD